MLEINAVTKSFYGVNAIDKVSFHVEKGSITSLIGPNGAGKTTLINMITGVLLPTSGDIQFKGQSLNGLSPHQVGSLGIRRTFQTVRLFNGLSVRENLLIGRIRSLLGISWLQMLLPIKRIRDTGVTVLLVEHDMSMVMSVSDKIVVLNFGQKISEGSPGYIQGDPQVIASYLGS